MGAATTFARVRGRIEHAASRVDATTTAARRKYRSVEMAFDTYERDKRAVGNVLAGAIAFRLFVYLLPLVLAIMVILGIIAGFDPTQPERLASNAGLGKTIVDSVATATAASKKSLWVLIPLSLYALYSGGSGVIKVLRAIHSVAWGQPLTKLRRGVVSAFALFGVAAGLLAVLLLLQWIRKNSGGLGLTATVATTVVFSGAWFLASRALPHGDAPWQALIPGAVLVGVGLEALHLVSVYYLGNKIASASELYGSLGAAAVIIAWLYLIGRLFVASAMLNASAWERRRTRPGDHAAPVRHHFASTVITLGGDDKVPRREHNLVRSPLPGEDGRGKPRSGRR
jgi:uncharacterized BrkB/YihY/UPF0761 family membrane protein